MLQGEYPIPPQVVTEENGFGWRNPFEDKSCQDADGDRIIWLFRKTARILDEVLFEQSGGSGYCPDPKQENLYWGLVWLKQRADELGVTITNDLPGPGASEVTKHVYAIFDGMAADYVQEILNPKR